MQKPKIDVLNVNEVRVIGILADEKSEVKQTAKGDTYISGEITVKSNLNGQEQLTELRFFSMANKSDGTPNKLFETYSNLNRLLGKRISVLGRIEENRFYNAQDDRVISSNRPTASFISEARKTDTEDLVTFAVGGFVAKPLAEKVNKEGDIYGYELTLIQTDFRENPVALKLSVDPANKKAINFIESNYLVGSTVRVNGNIEITTEVDTREEEVAFGEPVVKTFINTRKNFSIVSGTFPVEGVGQYSSDLVSELVATYKENEVLLKQASMDKTPATSSATKAKNNAFASLL